MWLFTKHGLLSIVADKSNDDNLLVRARQAHHITEIIPGCIPKYTPKADYHWRISLDRTVVAGAIASVISEIRYANFKDSADKELKATYMKVWLDGLELQADRYARVNVVPFINQPPSDYGH